MLSSMLALLFMKPINAQNSDGFFHYNEFSYENRDTDLGFNIGTQIFGSGETGGFAISTQVFGQEAPLDGGLLIMFGSGAFYLAMKRKRDHRRFDRSEA